MQVSHGARRASRAPADIGACAPLWTRVEPRSRIGAVDDTSSAPRESENNIFGESMEVFHRAADLIKPRPLG